MNRFALYCFTSFFCAHLFGLDPDLLVGQKANFKLDKDPKRTTSLLKKGTFQAVIKSYQPQAENGPAMEVALDYRFDVEFMGEQSGVESGLLDYEYFTEDFLVKLRKEGKYESENFKAIHQGFKDAKTLEGKFYPHCDVILLYDIKDSTLRNSLGSFLATIVQAENQSDIKDMKVLAHIYPGIPVLGAVKIDVSGKHSGMNIKAGADYQTP